MATTAWSSLIATLALVWWLSATTTGGIPLSSGQLQKSRWMQHTPDRLEKKEEEEDVRRQSISSTHSVVKRFSRPDPWKETIERLSSNGITPEMLKQLLRETSQWSARKPASKRGQKEVNDQDSATGEEVAKWKDELDSSLRHGKSKKRWLDLFGGSSVETRFPLPERRQFPEVDWRGFNEDVFHESFGDFNPMKRWKRSSRKV